MDRKRVMIIDDDAENLNIMVRQLETLYDVKGYLSGEEALSVLCSGGVLPNIIVLDIVMPGMDGYEVLSRLKGNDKLKKIPVVFLTGVTDESSECRGLEMDAVDYLKKPVAGKVLLARVQHYLELYSVIENGGKLDETRLQALEDPLSERELEVARLMAEFRSDREMSEILCISMPYTKKIVASVKEKLELEKRGDIRRYLV